MLNGGRYASAEVKARVRQAVEQLGYTIIPRPFTAMIKPRRLRAAQESLIFIFVDDLEPDTIGGRLRRARVARGLSQAAVASAAGVGRETVYRVELGRDATADTLARLASALRLEREHLMLEEGYSSRLYGHPRRTPLRDRRRGMGLTLRHCAEMAGVSEATLSRFERGNHFYPSLCVVGRTTPAASIHNEGLAKALGFANAEALTDFWLAGR